MLKVHTQPIKRSNFGFNKGAKGQPKAPLVWCTGLSGAPEDSNANSPPSGISRGDSAIIHRTVRCTPDMSGAPRKVGLRNSPASGFSPSPLRYNSPDCPVCTGLSGATSEQRLLRANGYLQRHLMRAQRAQESESPILAHRTANSTCPVCTGHPGGSTSQKLQRSESNGSDDVAGGTGLSGVHRTVRCAPDCPVCHRADSLPNGHIWWLGL